MCTVLGIESGEEAVMMGVNILGRCADFGAGVRAEKWLACVLWVQTARTGVWP